MNKIYKQHLCDFSTPEDLEYSLNKIVALSEFVNSLDYKDMSNEEQKYIIDQLVSIAKYAKSIQAGIKLNDTLMIKKLEETELVGINFSGKCRVIHSGDK